MTAISPTSAFACGIVSASGTTRPAFARCRQRTSPSVPRGSVVSLLFVLSPFAGGGMSDVDARLVVGHGFCVVVAGPGDAGGVVELSLLLSPPQAIPSAVTAMRIGTKRSVWITELHGQRRHVAIVAELLSLE